MWIVRYLQRRRRTVVPGTRSACSTISQLAGTCLQWVRPYRERCRRERHCPHPERFVRLICRAGARGTAWEAKRPPRCLRGHTAPEGKRPDERAIPHYDRRCCGRRSGSCLQFASSCPHYDRALRSDLPGRCRAHCCECRMGRADRRSNHGQHFDELRLRTRRPDCTNSYPARTPARGAATAGYARWSPSTPGAHRGLHGLHALSRWRSSEPA